jgi:hypothetical protein
MSDVCATTFDAPREKSRGATLHRLEGNCAAREMIRRFSASLSTSYNPVGSRDHQHRASADHRGELHEDRIESGADGGLAGVDLAVRYLKRFE